MQPYRLKLNKWDKLFLISLEKLPAHGEIFLGLTPLSGSSATGWNNRFRWVLG